MHACPYCRRENAAGEGIERDCSWVTSKPGGAEGSASALKGAPVLAEGVVASAPGVGVPILAEHCVASGGTKDGGVVKQGAKPMSPFAAASAELPAETAVSGEGVMSVVRAGSNLPHKVRFPGVCYAIF